MNSCCFYCLVFVGVDGGTVMRIGEVGVNSCMFQRKEVPSDFCLAFVAAT